MKVGERYVIEIDEIFWKKTTNIYDDTKLARIKGFNSLVFDENGLSKLSKLADYQKQYDKARQEGYEMGKAEAYDLNKKLDCDKARIEGFEEGKKVGYNEALIECEDNRVLNHDGCIGCEHELQEEEKFPCCACIETHFDMYKPKEEKLIGEYDICRFKDEARYGNYDFCVTRLHRDERHMYFDAIRQDGATMVMEKVKDIRYVRHIDSLDEWLKGE